ncbi:hypothetical protein Isop_1025 [Isosphaera pallida ATCC 43644]|jgi:hypothetical protein|uniref:Uncharacterized protein n=1 Tax=Isosphaera pallida (strain ATCC 43644 / DSM 9630 / IS1B) TaxID=575540 RepID=E8R427_ISOPI|nr:hypothetical protein [Isosphaera pallida]ADV61614.1 hypothetical protein Isop_1025 [Isosphaera pallida ATCC 43644]
MNVPNLVPQTPVASGKSCLVAGLLIGVLGTAFIQGAASGPKFALGGGGDRVGESIVAAGPVISIYNPATKSMMEQDGLYYLDYRRGRLLATIPGQQFVGDPLTSRNAKLDQAGIQPRYIQGFVERDLVRDFGVAPGSTPRFMMVVGRILNDGWAPLFVFETTTGKVATYRLSMAGTKGQASLELLEVTTIGHAGEP